MTFKSPSIHRTPLYRAKSAYRSMCIRCKGSRNPQRGYENVEVRVSKKKFLKWAVPRYAKFIAKYPDISPCVARTGDRGHYEIGNIRIISVKQNRKEQILSRVSRNVGRSNPWAKLTESKVRKARRLKSKGWTYKQLSDRFGVSTVTIRSAVLGKTWSHVI